MDFSCIASLHIVYVIPKETCSVGFRRCGMCTRYNCVCMHMSDTLSVTCCLEWHLLSGWLMYNWMMWHFFPWGLHCAWFFMPFIKCKEPSRHVCKGVWAQEAAGKPRNSSTCVFKWKCRYNLVCKNRKVNWMEWILYPAQKVQTQESVKSGFYCCWVVTQMSESLLESLPIFYCFGR